MPLPSDVGGLHCEVCYTARSLVGLPLVLFEEVSPGASPWTVNSYGVLGTLDPLYFVLECYLRILNT